MINSNYFEDSFSNDHITEAFGDSGECDYSLYCEDISDDDGREPCFVGTFEEWKKTRIGGRR